MSRTTPVVTMYTSAEVAKLFQVEVGTVLRWAKAGKLTTTGWTLGGHRRFSIVEVDALLSGSVEKRL